jgi:hypothetical protein
VTEEGWHFAYRERAHTPGDPVRPVELVKEGPPRSQKVKVRWLYGEYEGLEKWIPKVQLVVSREEKEALLEDERRMFAALEAYGDVYGTTTYQAKPSRSTNVFPNGPSPDSGRRPFEDVSVFVIRVVQPIKILFPLRDSQLHRMWTSLRITTECGDALGHLLQPQRGAGSTPSLAVLLGEDVRHGG